MRIRCAVMAMLIGLAGSAEATFNINKRSTVNGVVEGNGAPQAGYRVSLYASYTRGKPFEVLLGRDRTDGAGAFSIEYQRHPGLHRFLEPVLYLLAEKGEAMVASAVVDVEKYDHFVVNERTTVAIGTAFAQFIDGRRIRGNPYGMANAVKMAANMANPVTGEAGQVLRLPPNGELTSTYRTFNTLANIVASCVAASANCDLLFQYATPAGGPAPKTVLQAIANMTKYPSNNVAELFGLASNAIYSPALADAPNSWLLFIKFTGGFYSEYADTNLMSGPGNVAFDERGFAWINDNYVPSAERELSCAGLRVMKFYPWGERFLGSPYFGGGLSGAGFGIAVDGHGGVWVGNFGFEAPVCDGSLPPNPAKKIPATHNSVSLFRPNGSPVSGPDGFTNGHIWWPQATVADRKGNVWLANCGNDTVTLIPRGKPRMARNIPLPHGQGELGHYEVRLPKEPLLKPFAIAIDPKGRAWVTGNRAGHVESSQPAGRVYRISPDGSVETLPHTNGNTPLLSWPMGIAGDSKGNMWVSNSDAVNVPCVTPLDRRRGGAPSVALYPADDGPPRIFTGGGLTIPWGNAVDGNDTLWVFNFGHPPFEDVDENTVFPDTAVSHFCGADARKCPAGLTTGDPISKHGYTSDALDRVTGGGVDPSGNLWLMNNWKQHGPSPEDYNSNPGGNSFVIVPGAAAPIKTPLLGPPEGFDSAKRH